MLFLSASVSDYCGVSRLRRVTSLTLRIADFHENPGGGHERPAAGLAPAHGGFMPFILGIEQREEIRGVGEGHGLLLGAPWR